LPVKTTTGNDLMVTRGRQHQGRNTELYNYLLMKMKEIKEKEELPVAYTAYNAESQKVPHQNDVQNQSDDENGYNPEGQQTGNVGIAYIKNILHKILNVKTDISNAIFEDKPGGAQVANPAQATGEQLPPVANSVSSPPSAYNLNIPQSDPDVNSEKEGFSRGGYARELSPRQKLDIIILKTGRKYV